MDRDGTDRFKANGDAASGEPGFGWLAARAEAEREAAAREAAAPAEAADAGREPLEAVTVEKTAVRALEPAPADDALPAEELEAARALVDRGPVVLVVPSEALIYFYPAGPEQVINALHAAGFDQIYFESLGDELVALAYLRMWRENTERRTWIRSTSPLVVEYCRARHPELLPYLAPIVPPALALARYLRHLGEDRPLIYAGLESPEVNGERHFAAALSFPELAQFLHERGTEPRDQPLLLRSLPPERRRFVSAAGGLPLAMLDEERHSSRFFRRLRGMHYLSAVSRLVEENGSHLGFIDILPFDGNLDHPTMGPADELYRRRALLELAEPDAAEGPVIESPPGLDLTIMHRPRRSKLPEEAVAEIERALEEVRRQADGLEIAEPSDYAGYLSLTESMVRNRPELAIGLLAMSRNYFRAVRDATHDALTDLYSYRALVERVREELGQANRAEQKLALLFIDLDRFKEINDQYGHPVGNELLRGVARELEMAIRSTDIAGRFGGDEFVLVLIDPDFEGALRVAEDVRARIANLRISVDDGWVGTTASVGIAFHAGSEGSLLSADDLFAEADAALYIAKAHGGNRVHPAVREGTPR